PPRRGGRGGGAGGEPRPDLVGGDDQRHGRSPPLTISATSAACSASRRSRPGSAPNQPKGVTPTAPDPSAGAVGAGAAAVMEDPAIGAAPSAGGAPSPAAVSSGSVATHIRVITPTM